MKWTRFERGINKPLSPSQVKRMAEAGKVSIEEAQRVVDARLGKETWINNRYQVAVDRGPDIIHLSIKRLDRAAVHDWRDLQRIKNDLVGPDHEAVELYPAEERLVDTANQYHLWVLAKAGQRFPFGYNERLVSYGAENRQLPGSNKRKPTT